MAQHNANLLTSGTVTAPSGVFADTLTISGVPVAVGAGVSDPLNIGTINASTSLTISGEPVATGTGGGGASDIDSINAITSGAITIDGSGGVAVNTLGQTITIDGSGVSGGGGSGSGGELVTSGTWWSPYAIPESPHAQSDWFDDNSSNPDFDGFHWIDWDKWTLWDVTSVSGSANGRTYGSNQGGTGASSKETNVLLVHHDGSTGGGWMGFYQDAPAGSFTITAKVGQTMSYTEAADHRMGVFIADDLAGAPSTSDFLTCSLYSTNAINVGWAQWEGSLWSDYQTQGINNASFAGNAPGVETWVRIAYNASSGRTQMQVSDDGYHFRELYRSDPLPFTPSHIGFAVEADGGGNFGIIEMFAVANVFTGTFPAGYGRLLPIIVSGTTGGGGSGVTDPLVLASGVFSESLTISGVPVSTGTGGGGAGTLTDINTTATGPSVTITGAGAIETITEGNVITISGIPLAGNSRWDPFIPPASGSVYDDEFEGTVGDAPDSSKWTTFDPGSDITTMNLKENPGRLQIKQGTAGEFGGLIFPRVDADGSFAAYTYVGITARTSRTATLEHYAGIAIIEDKDAPTTSNIILAGLHWDKTTASPTGAIPCRIGMWEFDSYNDTTETARAGEIELSDFTTGGGVFLRLRYVNTSNAFDFDWSTDGISWHEVAQFDIDTGSTMTAFDALGLLSRHSGDTDSDTEFSFFRFLENTSGLTSDASRLPAGILGANIADPDFGNLTAVTGTFTESLTVSGVPVNIGAGGGAGTLTDINTTATGPSVTITGVGTVSTLTEGNAITISGSSLPSFEGDGFRGFVLTSTSGVDATGTTSAGQVRIPWDTEVMNTDSFFNPAGDDAVITIPAGINKMRFGAKVQWDSTDEGGTRSLSIRRVSGPTKDTIDQVLEISAIPAAMDSVEYLKQGGWTEIVDVVAGELWEAIPFWKNTTAATTITLGNTGLTNRKGLWFAGEVIDPVSIPDDFTVASGTFTQSLTVSGVPVSIGASASTLQDAYDGGDGTISTTGGKPFELTGTGELTAVTGTFTDGLTVGGASTTIDGVSITTGSGIFDQMFLDGTAVTIAQLTSPAASGTGRWDPFMPPATPDSSGLDDAFEGPLDTSTKWTVFDNNTVLSSPPHTNINPNRMTLDWGTLQNDLAGIHQPFADTDGDIHIITHVMLDNSSQEWSGNYNHDHWAGMFLLENSAAPTTSNILFFGIHHTSGPAFDDPVVWELGCWEFTQFDQATPTQREISQTTSDHAFAGGNFLRLKWDGTNNVLRADWSKDGRGWNTFSDIDIDTDTTMTSFNAVGLCSSRRVGFMDRAEFSFFRALTGGNFHGIGEMMPAGQVGGVPETFSTISGSFSESLTVSGVPVATGTSYRGALLRQNDNQNYTTSVSESVVWDQAVEDTDGFFVPATPSGIVIPAGVNRVRFDFLVNFEADAGMTGIRTVGLRKNYEAALPGVGAVRQNAATETWANTVLPGFSAAISVTAGDFFDLFAYQNSGGDLTTFSGTTWFAVEVVE